MHGTLPPSFLQHAKQNKYANTVPAKHRIVLTMQVPKNNRKHLVYTPIGCLENLNQWKQEQSNAQQKGEMGRKAVQEIATIRAQYDGRYLSCKQVSIWKDSLEWLVCLRIAGSHLYKGFVLFFRLFVL